MKCTSNHLLKKLLCLICIAALFIGGCGNSNQIANSYPVYTTDIYVTGSNEGEITGFTQDLCVTEDVNFGTEDTDSQVAEGAGVFNLSTKEVCYSQNMFTKLYPASTTKILTAYIILKNCNLEEFVQVSENAVDQESDSSVCGLKSGDVISVRDLLYGLMLASGNDAAVALAEYYANSEETFAEIMNREALALGASNSHFTNANGLPDENHYTTVYDMYLIFQAALEIDEFINLISAETYEASYTDSQGAEVHKTWSSTNKYLTGGVKTPDGYTIIGGKTGTTNAAGYCLVLYSLNEKEEEIISIVFKADGRSNLYLLMNQILSYSSE